jgi:integrase
MARPPTGVEIRHSRTCPAQAGGTCKCSPTYRAEVYSRRDRGKIRRSFSGPGALTAAKAWRADASGAVRRGVMRAPKPTTLQEAWDAWIEGAETGTVRTRGGHVYKPSALRGYRAAMSNRILPALGAARLADIQQVDIQDLADRWLAEGLDPSTVRNFLMPFRAVCRRALQRHELTLNPTANLELAAAEGSRDRIASPDEAGKLLAALPADDKALWAAALYAGLRRGELAGLDWESVDFERNLLRVVRSWDPGGHTMVAPKSSAGSRAVPIASALRGILLEHHIRHGRPESGLVFGRDAETPFSDWGVNDRARKLWAAAGLERITLHEGRHTFASLMIAAGVNAKALSTYMGHSSITITLDRYGHMFPGNEDEAAALLDAYLERQTVPQTVPQQPQTLMVEPSVVSLQNR